jgi:hypothetical protein
MGAILNTLVNLPQTWTLPIMAQGDGSGVATMRVNVAGPVEVTIAGSAHFYTNSAGTTGESQWKLLTTGWNTIYMRLASGASALQFGCADRIVGWGDNSNSGWDAGTTAPVPNMVMDDIPRRVTTIWLQNNVGVIKFNSQYHTALTYLRLADLPGITGTFNSQYHTAITQLLLVSLPGITGTFNSQYHTALTYIYLNTLPDLTGTFNSQYHAELTYLRLVSLPGITGTWTIGSGIALTGRLYITLPSFTSTMIDAILIDTDNNTTLPVATQPIYLANGNAPTAASAAAIASLRAKGNTVTTS